MKQLYKIFSVFILIAAISSGVAIAQTDSTKLNQSVEVMKAYRPSISNAHKVNLMPVIEDTTRFSPEFKYAIDSQPVNSSFAASAIKPADVNKLAYKNPGLGYLKLGAGTSNSIYGEFFLNLPESKSATFGLHLRHLSSDGNIKLKEGTLVPAPFSQDNAAIYGSVNIGNTILSTDLSYDRDAMRYYGYPASIPAKIDSLSSLSSFKYGLKQAYDKGNFKVALRSNEKLQGNLTFNSGVRMGFFDSKTGQKENSGGLFGKFDYNFGPVHGILDLSYDHFSTDSIKLAAQQVPGTKSNDWIRIAPSVSLNGDNWFLRGGINFVASTDKDGGNSNKLYPDFEFNFRPVEGILTLYAGLKGDLKNNRYGDIALENYWADPRHNVLNTDYNYVVSGGLKGKISREISYNIGVNYSQVKDMYFYVFNSDWNASTNPAYVYNNQFDVKYDNAKITDFSAEFSYISGNDLSIVVGGHYYNYQLDSMPFASQKPNFDLSASIGVQIVDKLKGFADLKVVGSQKVMVYNHKNPSASAVSTDELFALDTYVGLNLGATYELSSNLRLFGRVDNVLNRTNEQWLGYASQGLRVIAGVSVSF